MVCYACNPQTRMERFVTAMCTLIGIIYFLQPLHDHWHYRCEYELRLDVLLVAVKMEKDKLIAHEKGELFCDIIVNYRETKQILPHGVFCHP
jgi:hypothetical protein